MADNDEVIRLLLREHGDWLVGVFREALRKNRDTGSLDESFTTGVTGGTDGATLTIEFNLYGRFAEIRSRRHTKARNSDVWQQRNGRRKRVLWYSNNRYRGYGRLIRLLTAGLSEQQLQQLRQAVEQAAAG